MKGKIRFGMVGTGFIADWVLAGARQDPRFEAAAICSRNQATADAFAAKHGIPHTFTSLEEMARSPLVVPSISPRPTPCMRRRASSA